MTENATMVVTIRRRCLFVSQVRGCLLGISWEAHVRLKYCRVGLVAILGVFDLETACWVFPFT